jgi:ABC-type sugar transport system substrate-binding protein
MKKEKKMKRKRCVTLAVIAVLTLFLFASVVYGEGEKKAGEEAMYTFYLFEVSFGHTYFIGHIHGAQEAATKHPNVNLVVLDGRDDPGFQSTQVIQSLAKKPDALLVNCVTENGLVSALQEAKRAGVTVVTTDRDVADFDLRIAHIGSKQVDIGRLAGAYAVDYLKKSGLPKPWKVVVLEGLAGNIANTERTAGWFEALNPLIDKGDIKIVADVPAGWAREEALTKMQEILVKSKDINLVLASNDQEAAGAMIACEAAGLSPGRDILFVGVDADAEGLQMIKDGKMLATVAHQAWLQGYWAVEMALAYIEKGKKPSEDKWPNRDVITDTFMVDKKNVAKVGPFGEPIRTNPDEIIEAPPLPY